MKIYILGPSASGKTTLAKKIAEKKNIPIFHSDFVLTEYEGRKRTKLDKKEYMEKVKKILSKDNWIFEGKHLIPDLLESADKIIWLKTPLLITLFRQWKRYFTEKEQRRRFTFRNNLQLSAVILCQNLGREDKSRKNDPRHCRQRKYKRILKKYKDKVVEIKTDKDIEALL
jgi:adenylate kinase family enzyme